MKETIRQNRRPSSGYLRLWGEGGERAALARIPSSQRWTKASAPTPGRGRSAVAQGGRPPRATGECAPHERRPATAR
eukprot:scaffold68353_cov21-Prasinocladus_malaysianus.AAC.1